MRAPRRSSVSAPALAGAVAVATTWLGFKELQPDSYRLLYTGRWIAQHGIPGHDVFTVAAAGRPFADQQWLAELLHYEVWRVAGYAGVALMSAGAFALGYALVAALMRRRGASPTVSVACALLALVGAISLTFVRAQNLVIPLFVVVLWLCLEAAGDRPPREPADRTSSGAGRVGQPARLGRHRRGDRHRLPDDPGRHPAAGAGRARHGRIRGPGAGLRGRAVRHALRHARPHLLPEHVRQRRREAGGHRVGRAGTWHARLPSIPAPDDRRGRLDGDRAPAWLPATNGAGDRHRADRGRGPERDAQRHLAGDRRGDAGCGRGPEHGCRSEPPAPRSRAR